MNHQATYICWMYKAAVWQTSIFGIATMRIRNGKIINLPHDVTDNLQKLQNKVESRKDLMISMMEAGVLPCPPAGSGRCRRWRSGTESGHPILRGEGRPLEKAQ